MRRIFFGLIGMMALTGCGGGGSEEDAGVSDVDRLYYSVNKLIRTYADSLRTAPDSAAVVGAFERFNAQLDTLNFSVAPDTDLLLTEGQNDTIYLNLMGLRHIYDRRLKELGLSYKPVNEEQFNEKPPLEYEIPDYNMDDEQETKEKPKKDKPKKEQPKKENPEKQKPKTDD